MAKYIFKRLLISIFTLWIMYTIIFFLMHAVPGNPFSTEKTLDPSVIESLNKKYGLDQPQYIQYLKYTNNLLHGDLGESIKQKGMTVNEIIAMSFPYSAKIGGIAVAGAVVLGVICGIIASVRRNTSADRIVLFLATLGMAVPSFVIAAVLMVVFCLNLKLLPAIGLTSAKSYILPCISLGLISFATVTRYMRSSMLDVINQDYIRTARAKGLSDFKVIFVHGLRNGILPVVTYLGPLIAAVLTGSFIIESIFTIPGLGSYFVKSITNRDYAVILGTAVFYGGFLIMMNFIVDILYVVIDPRIKFTKA